MLDEFIFVPDASECHASTLVELPDKTLLCAWFQGSKEGNSDVRIYWSRRNLSGKWTIPAIVPWTINETHWNPVLFRLPDNTIKLFFKVGMQISDWQTYCCNFDLVSEQWSSPQELVPGDISGGRGPVKNKPILLADQTILAPASIEHKRWQSFVDRSTDRGQTWHKSELVPTTDDFVADEKCDNHLALIQPTLWESAPGVVHMLIRSNCGFICRSDSTDSGQTWTTAYRTELNNNNSGIDLVQLSNHTLLLVANTTNTNWGARDKLVLYCSKDQGDTWQVIKTLIESPNMEFSYPAIIALSDNCVAVSFTWNRKSIKFMLLDVN